MRIKRARDHIDHIRIGTPRIHIELINLIIANNPPRLADLSNRYSKRIVGVVSYQYAMKRGTYNIHRVKRHGVRIMTNKRGLFNAQVSIVDIVCLCAGHHADVAVTAGIDHDLA